MSDAKKPMPAISTFEASVHGVWLNDTRLTAVTIGSSLWCDLVAGEHNTGGALFGVYQVSTNEEVHSSQWERHPFSDELVGIVSGAMTLFLDDTTGFNSIKLTSLTAVIIPAGVWHRFEVTDPTLMFSLARRNGTELREVHNG